MPAVIGQEITPAGALKRTKRWQAALAALDDDGAADSIADILSEDQAGGLSTTALSQGYQRLLRDIRIEGEEYYKHIYRKLHSLGKFGQTFPTPDSFWDVDPGQVPALCHRLTSFISYKRAKFVGQDGPGRPCVTTVRYWVDICIATGKCRSDIQC